VTSLSFVQRSPTDCSASLCVRSRNLVNEEAPAHLGWGGATAPNKENLYFFNDTDCQLQSYGTANEKYQRAKK